MKKFLNTKIKDMKAITLIALVITIVVLIILAAVAINLTLGGNGIFNRAKIAKEQYQNAQDYEQTEIAKATNEIESNVKGNREQIMVDKDVYEQLILDVAKLKADLANIQNDKMNNDKIIVETQTVTTNQYASVEFDNKEGYIPIAAISTSGSYYLVKINGNWFRAWDGNATGFTDSVKKANTSITAYVIYVKVG